MSWQGGCLSSYQSMLSIHLLRYCRMSMGNESSYSWSTCSRYLQSSIWSWHHWAIFWWTRVASWGFRVKTFRFVQVKTKALNEDRLNMKCFTALWWRNTGLLEFLYSMLHISRHTVHMLTPKYLWPLFSKTI